MELTQEPTHRFTERKPEIQNFNRPKEIRNFQKGHLELIQVAGKNVTRSTFEPGWRWSEHIQPIAKTISCEIPHFQYHLSGVLAVKMDNGEIYECRPGDVSMLPAGHDAWVVGEEPVVVIDFQGATNLKEDR